MPATDLQVFLFNVALGPRYDDSVPLSELPVARLNCDPNEALSRTIDIGLSQIDHDVGIVGEPVAHGYFIYLPDQSLSAGEPVRWAHLWHCRLYGVTKEGRLIVDDEHLRRMTVGDLQRAGATGEAPADGHQVVVIPPEGLGGPPEWIPDVVTFMEGVGASLVADALRGLVRRSGKRRDAPLRTAAQQWAQDGITDPSILREWLETRPAWTTQEVAGRLSIDAAAARDFLTALGYQESSRSGAWSLGDTGEAKRRRDAWRALEDESWRRPRR